MDYRALAIGAALLVPLFWFFRGFTVRVTGTWERTDGVDKLGAYERLSLVQFGPFIRGRRVVEGGFQEFSGFLRGRTLFISRRDYGLDMIGQHGFPTEIAPLVDGTVTAKFRLTISKDGQALFGTFSPQKIEFTVKPPAITGRYFLEASHRRYRLVTRKIVAG